MAYTSHGHHIAGTVWDHKVPPNRARCGGPGLCVVCSLEAGLEAEQKRFNQGIETHEQPSLSMESFSNAALAINPDTIALLDDLAKASAEAGVKFKEAAEILKEALAKLNKNA